MPSSAPGEPLLATRDVNAPPASGNHLADALAKYIAAAAALHPPRRIRRGASVASALSKYGQIFTTNPDKLPYEQRARLFGRSEVVEQIDAFVSHSWGSPGYMKYMTLLLEEAAPYAIVTNCLASLLAAFFQGHVYEISFGTTRMTYGFEPFFTLLQVWSPWIWFAGIAAGYVTFLVVPALKRRRFYFVDGLCISQTDPTLKLQGIRHLGGFVALSRSLLVMWDEQYLSRLWCVYELAVFRAVHPHRPVRLLPMRLSIAVAIICVTMLVGTGFYAVGYPSLCASLGGIAGFFVAAYLASVLFYLGCTIAGVDLALQRRVLEAQFDGFDARAASCYNESDRVEIYAAIERITDGGLDAFNAMVRTTLKEEVLRRSFGGGLPYVYLMTGLLPLIALALGPGVAQLSEAPFISRVDWYIYGPTFAFCTGPLVGAWCVDDGSAIAVRASSAAGTAVKLAEVLRTPASRNAVLRSAARGAFWLAGVHCGISYFLVQFIANRPDYFGLRSVDSVWLAIVSNGYCVVRAYLTFRATPVPEHEHRL